VSERIIVIQLNGNPVNMNIVHVYVSTADAEDVKIDQVYNEISELLKQFKKHEMIIIIDDFNTKIGKAKCGDLVGEHSLNIRNEREDRMKLFVEDLIELNTFFKLPPRRLYTWISPWDQPGGIVRNQIDYMFIPKRSCNSCLGVKTYPGAEIESDHCPVVRKI